jgi:hypothetical protein
MYDLSTELKFFYDNHVRLGTPLRNELAGYRDLNLQRLTEGLTALGDERGTAYKTFADNKNQGSYAMHTLNQSDEYDIDVAVIWNQEDLPANATEARELVRDALLKKCQNFSKEPTARGNAVTVWYADGYHIDFAVYRRSFDWFGNVARIEHAGADGWAGRDPLAFSDWFSQVVKEKSAVGLLDELWTGPMKVAPDQLRRIVRFVKAFAKSRTGWALPGGVILTTLVCETYIRDKARDDVSLVATLRAMERRLYQSLQVDNPVQPGTSLVASEKRQKEMQRLRDKLSEKVPRLDVLDEPDCTSARAIAAWREIFNDDYWTSGISAQQARGVTAAASALQVECWLAKHEQGRVYQQYMSGGKPLPKRVGLRFTAKPVGVVGPYQVRWTVQNEGDEASEANQIRWDKLLDSQEPMWTSTKYKGRHTMVAEVLQRGVVVRRGELVVRIGGWM